MLKQEDDDCFFIERRCPNCSAKLLTDGTWVWCSLLEGNADIECEFGHDRDINLVKLIGSNMQLVAE